MAFFYFSKYQFLPVLLLSYTFLTSLLITRCSPPNIAIFGTVDSDLDQLQLLEKTNSFLAETKLNIENQRQFSYTLDCANEDSFQENTLNLNKHLKEERLKNTGAFSVFGIRITNPTSECKQQLVNILKDIDLIPLYETSTGQKNENDQDVLEVFVVFNVNGQQQKPHFDRENNNFDISKINVMHQGVEAGDIGTALVVLILLGLAAAGVVIFIRRKKKKAQKKQLKVEKQKFIPRLQLSSQAPFNGQKEAGSKPSSTKKNKNLDVPKILSPTGRHAHALRLEDNHQSSIINDNIFTNLDNSPRSVDDDSDIQSVKNTPKDIGFNIEFSMIEQDSKIKSARDHEE